MPGPNLEHAALILRCIRKRRGKSYSVWVSMDDLIRDSGLPAVEARNAIEFCARRYFLGIVGDVVVWPRPSDEATRIALQKNR